MTRGSSGLALTLGALCVLIVILGVAVPDVLPDEYRRLAQHGFDLPAYLASQPLGTRT